MIIFLNDIINPFFAKMNNQCPLSDQYEEESDKLMTNPK